MKDAELEGRDERNFLKKLIRRKCPAVSGKTISKILDGKIVDREVGVRKAIVSC